MRYGWAVEGRQTLATYKGVDRKDNLMIRKIALTVGASVILTTSLIGTADAGTAKYAPSSCEFTGVTNVFGTYGESLTYDPGTVQNDTFSEFYCERVGMRVYKAVANTSDEIATLREVADKNGTKDTHVVFCQVGERARMLDLAQSWAMKGVDSINAREADGWESYAKRYAQNHEGCRVYR